MEDTGDRFKEATQRKYEKDKIIKLIEEKIKHKKTEYFHE